MIGKLTGVLDSASEDALLLDVGGVGYRVHAPARTLARLGPPGSRLSLMVETHVREDEIKLYGFETEAERLWFRALQTVQGVGAKLALAILSTLGPGELARAILFADKITMGRAPGVGPKLALRIISELKDRAPPGAPVHASARTETTPDTAVADRALSDALSALINLGYGQADAASALAAAQSRAATPLSIEALIRAGLKELSR